MKSIFLALSSFFILTMMSCKDKDPVTRSNTSDPVADINKLNKLLEDNAPSMESFQFDASTGDTIVTKDGNLLVFYPKSLKDANGNDLQGPVNVEITEINSPSEMIFAKMPTMTLDGQILESGGEYRINVSQNGNPVFVSDSVQAPLLVASRISGADMMGWDGNPGSTIVSQSGYDYQNMLTSTFVDIPNYLLNTWIPNPDLNVTTDANNYYWVMDSLNGVNFNFDILYQSTAPKTTVLCYFDKFNPESYKYHSEGSSSMLFFKPNGTNAILAFSQLIIGSPVEYSGYLSNQNVMPIGMAGDFLAVTVIEGKIYAQKKNVAAIPTPDAGKNYVPIQFNLVEITETDLVDMIKSFD